MPSLPNDPLWSPAPGPSNLSRFLETVNSAYGLDIRSYADLHRWSVDHADLFWHSSCQSTGVRWIEPYKKTLDPAAPLFPPQVPFQGATLNFAQNLLYPSPGPLARAGPNRESHPALIAATETGRLDVSWKQLRDRVARCQAAIAAAGIKKGDRVVGIVGNNDVAVIAMLAAASLGAIWSAVSPDTGVFAIVERMRQIEPALLVADNGSAYAGKRFCILEKVGEVVSQLPTLRHAIINQVLDEYGPDIVVGKDTRVLTSSWAKFTDNNSSEKDLTFVPVEPDHPLYILYSSGTTGAPKCIVHGTAGTLVQHKKEHVIHGDIGPASTLFYYTTTTWMMWHWLVSALATGATIVLFDGSPFTWDGKADHHAMLRLSSEATVTHFGTSAKYLSVLEQKREQKPDEIDLSRIQAIYSTGSPLAPSTFRYLYSSASPFPATAQLSSITGGTDIVSLFGAPCALRPVQAGLIQCSGLGMALASFDESGKDVTEAGLEGDLVCTRPFVCQPVGFWSREEAEQEDEDSTVMPHIRRLRAGQAKYRDAYFGRFGVNVWHHGDHVKFAAPPEVVDSAETTSDAQPTSASHSGPFIILGRSDGVLKPAGVRFGSAELYNVLLAHFATEVADAVAVGWRKKDSTDPDEKVALFIRLSPDEVASRQGGALLPGGTGGAVTDQQQQQLFSAIKAKIRTELSPRHVPAVVAECADIPVTPNGKKMEVLVRKLVEGRVRAEDVAKGVANPECLRWYVDWAERQ